MKLMMKRFFLDERGATSIEYAIIASSIALAIIVAVGGIGGTLNTKFGSVNSSLK